MFGQGEATTTAILDFLEQYAPAELVSLLSEPISQLTTQSGAGLALVIGVAGALWTASGYTGAFGRAMNRIYEVGEGRPFLKLKPLLMLVTLAVGRVASSGPVCSGLRTSFCMIRGSARSVCR